jgi:hypothetical protein
MRVSRLPRQPTVMPTSMDKEWDFVRKVQAGVSSDAEKTFAESKKIFRK